MRTSMCALVPATIAVLLAVLAPVAVHATSNPGVVPPGGTIFGKSYAEWSAEWWRWGISMPIDNSPLMETAECDQGQTGPVWFLGGSFVSATVTRECTVPAGKALLFPVLNAECSTVEADPFHGENEAELRACAASFIDATAGLFAEIDGVPLQDLAAYRVQSPLYSFDAPENNVLFVPGPVSGQSISDGYWILLAPLPAGQHTIHFGGTFTNWELTLDVTYHVTVLPGGRGRGRVAGKASGVEPSSWGLVKNLYRD